MLPILVAERGRRCLSEHFVALPVDVIADAISTLGANVVEGFETYHVMNPYDDGIGMDTSARDLHSPLGGGLLGSSHVRFVSYGFGIEQTVRHAGRISRAGLLPARVVRER
ncbi:MAG: fatty acid CoA ligase FadD9 [Mycobacterium sp.]|nr:fatty acid CoA ligase FadD9 [Mycobacterium sp.]